MFDHRNMALEGMFPGLQSTFSIALRGEFETEVIIVPVVPKSAGGGWAPAPLHVRPRHFKVTVRVKYNGVWYEDTQILDENQARVIAELKGIKSFSTGNIMVSVNGVQIFEQEQITVTVNRIGSNKTSVN
jgi:hypothetical protein